LSEERFAIDIRQTDNYAFKVDFGIEGVPDLLLDEPEPLGGSRGPNPSRALAAAVGTCLSASLQFCLQKARVQSSGMHAHVEVNMARNEKGRLRIGGIGVEIEVHTPEKDEGRLTRCINLFKDYCVVTESVKNGIPVVVNVRREGQAGDYQ
jgi:uncharacterized OsmC-like protein